MAPYPNIAFCGFKGCGKDTAAEVLLNTGSYKKVAFADPIREIGTIVFGLTEEEMTDRVLKETVLDRWPYMSPRQILKDIGMMFREAYPGVWVEVWSRRRAEAEAAGLSTVTTDLRFPGDDDEEGACRKEGVTIVRVLRPQTDDETDPHPSEAGIPKIRPDVVLTNDRTLSEFRFNVDSVLLRPIRLSPQFP